MKIGQVYKKPSKEANRFFDGVEREKAEFSFLCGSCQQTIKHDLWGFLETASNWEQGFPASDVKEIKQEIKFPKLMDFIKSHEGGSPYLAISTCKHCSHKHLVYVGFYEFQPARYFGTLQGVYEAIT
jgi:hypothetical protein